MVLVVFFFLFMSLAFPFLSFLVSGMHSNLLLTDHVKQIDHVKILIYCNNPMAYLSLFDGFTN